MLQKTVLAIALAAAAAVAHAQTTPAPASPASAPALPSTPAKRELVARILKVQQPGIEAMARNLVEQPALEMMDRAANALPQRVPADKRESVARDIQADARKFVDETLPTVRERALKLAPTTIGTVLEERFTEDELKQIATMMESPVFAKFQQIGGEMQKALVDKLVTDTGPQVEPRVRTLEASIARRLGINPNQPQPPSGPAPTAPAATSKAPAKK
jgi:hypothetical protein